MDRSVKDSSRGNPAPASAPTSATTSAPTSMGPEIPLARSNRFEPGSVVLAPFARFESLSLLNQLVELVQQTVHESIGATSPPAEADPTPVQASVAPTARTPKAPAPKAIPEEALSYSSSRLEYRQALRDSSVVQALLGFHQRVVRTTAPLAGFRKAAHASVEARAKAPGFHRKGSDPSAPIYRPLGSPKK